MVIQHIKMEHLGQIECFEYDFADGLNVIKSRYTEEILGALRLVLNHRDSCLPDAWVNRNTRIEARVRGLEKIFRVVLTKKPGKAELHLYAYDERGAEVTGEYRYITSHCPAHDSADAFSGKAKTTVHRLLSYLDEDRYDLSQELAASTDRFSEIKAFRAYLKSFVKAFKPERLRAGKPYELILDPSGRFGVRYASNEEMPVFLSESEQLLFGYLCFLRTAEFWRGFEQLRNIHDVRKPLLVTDFLERLDASIDVQGLLERTLQLQRQLIVLST